VTHIEADGPQSEELPRESDEYASQMEGLGGPEIAAVGCQIFPTRPAIPLNRQAASDVTVLADGGRQWKFDLIYARVCPPCLNCT
jgi:hypothetical protein